MISMDLTKELTKQQRDFRLMLSDMFQTLTLFTFPQVFKADSGFVLIDTIKSIEISLRGVFWGQLIIHQLSNNILLTLRTLNEFKIQVHL